MGRTLGLYDLVVGVLVVESGEAVIDNVSV